MQFEQLPEVRLVLDDQDLEVSAGRASRTNARAPLQQLVDRRCQDAAMTARGLPGPQQAGLGPELHGAQRNAESIRDYLEALRIQPDSARLWHNLALCYEENRETERARECMAKADALRKAAQK